MCILLKLDYAKFGVSSLFLFSKVSEEKHLGGIGSVVPVKCSDACVFWSLATILSKSKAGRPIKAKSRI